MANSASRLLTLILLLQRQPGKKAAWLANELGVSIRTLHRYLTTLDEMGIPVYSERGPYGGFSLVRGYKMPPLIFTPEEAAAVFLGTSLVGELWGRLYQEAAASALVKMDNILPDEQRGEAAWARRTLVVSGMHQFDVEPLAVTLETLRHAVHNRVRLSLNYRGLGKMQATTRLMDAYALVFRWGWWYVVGFCHLRQALRTFRVDRIQNLTLLDDHYEIPVEFNIHDYLRSEPQPEALVEARLQFLPQATGLVHSLAFNWSSLENQPDQSVIVTLAAYDLDYAAQMVISFGTLVRVLEPKALRERVISNAAAVLDQYRSIE
jgi:predicted DNA-binding transcriptional regulator YafY